MANITKGDGPVISFLKENFTNIDTKIELLLQVQIGYNTYMKKTKEKDAFNEIVFGYQLNQIFEGHKPDNSNSFNTHLILLLNWCHENEQIYKKIKSGEYISFDSALNKLIGPNSIELKIIIRKLFIFMDKKLPELVKTSDYLQWSASEKDFAYKRDKLGYFYLDPLLRNTILKLLKTKMVISDGSCQGNCKFLSDSTWDYKFIWYPSKHMNSQSFIFISEITSDLAKDIDIYFLNKVHWIYKEFTQHGQIFYFSPSPEINQTFLNTFNNFVGAIDLDSYNEQNVLESWNNDYTKKLFENLEEINRPDKVGIIEEVFIGPKLIILDDEIDTNEIVYSTYKYPFSSIEKTDDSNYFVYLNFNTKTPISLGIPGENVVQIDTNQKIIVLRGITIQFRNNSELLVKID